MAFTSQLTTSVLQVEGRNTEGGVIEIVPGARLLLDVGVDSVEGGALLDEIAAAVVEAQAARDEAVDLSGISTPDGVIANRINTPGTETQVALSATIATAGKATFVQREDTASLALNPLWEKRGIVLARGFSPAATWMGIESPSVIRDIDGHPVKINGEYWLAYVGYGQTIDGQQRGTIGFAHATDLADAATYTKQTPSGFSFGPSMTPGDPDSDSVSGACAVLDEAGTTLHLYYMGGTEPGGEEGTITMCHASAPLAGVLAGTPTWTRHGQVLGLGAAGTWTDTAIWKPRVFRVPGGDDIVIFFNASGTWLGVADKERIGYAVSTTGLNGPFTRSADPILNVGRPGAWDADRIGDPSLELIGDVWVMDYFGNAEGGTRPSNGLAWTTRQDFPAGPGGGLWQKSPANPLLEPGPTFDVTAAHKPERVREIDGARRLIQLYTAVGYDSNGDGAGTAGQAYNIAAAVAVSGPAGLAKGSPLRFEEHAKADGGIAVTSTTWTTLDAGLDNYLRAQVGDVILVGLSARYADQAQDMHLQPVMVNEGGAITATRSVASDDTNGVAAWTCSANRYGSIGGVVPIVVTAQDLHADGTVRVRLWGKVSGGTKTLFATTPRLSFWAYSVGKANHL